MKLVVDALAASYGGIATYTEHLLTAWSDTFPADELHVVLPADSDWWAIPTGAVRHPVGTDGSGKLARALQITRALPRIAAQVSADAVLAANPATTLRRLDVPLGVVVHDLRHELRPDQFPVPTRIVRTVSHRRGYRVADVLVAVSERTRGDILARCPRVDPDRIAVVHEGGDHVRSWRRGVSSGSAVASCHHSNKDVGLLLDAWRLLGPDAPPLSLLGLSGERAMPVHARIDALELQDRVTVLPFLPDAEFQETVTGARLVVFVSDFEGFGLPVVETMQLGIPLVIGPEPACLEVANGHAEVLADWTPGALAAAVTRAMSRTEDELAAAADYADRFTWAATASRIRERLVAAAR